VVVDRLPALPVTEGDRLRAVLADEVCHYATSDLAAVARVPTNPVTERMSCLPASRR
jgi:hypothetical protein